MAGAMDKVRAEASRCGRWGALVVASCEAGGWAEALSMTITMGASGRILAERVNLAYREWVAARRAER